MQQCQSSVADALEEIECADGPGRRGRSPLQLQDSRDRETGRRGAAFARSRQEILDQARALRPPLVIFDLNSGKTDPIATIAAMKSDPALASIRTLGFVSHVRLGHDLGGA